MPREIVIDDDVRLGKNVIVLARVTNIRGVVWAAGAFATKNVQWYANFLAAPPLVS